MSRQRSAALPVALGAIAVVVGLVAFLVARAQRPPEGPVPIAWDREACAHCHMHVGDPSYAAQAQLSDGEVLNFDDPGCLLAWLAQHPDRAPRAIWLRLHDQDRWVPREEAGFVDAEPTPMGFGLAVVARGRAGALAWNDAAARVARRTERSR